MFPDLLLLGFLLFLISGVVFFAWRLYRSETLRGYLLHGLGFALCALALTAATVNPLTAQTVSNPRELHKLLVTLGLLTGTDGKTSGVCLLSGGSGCTMTGAVSSAAQVKSTLNPAGTTFAAGSVIANPAACASNEILMGAGVADTGLGTIDCEGDIVGVKGTYSGLLTSSAQVTSTLNPSDTTFANGAIIANPAACGTDEVLVGAGVASAAKGTIDCEGDVVGVKGTYTGLLTSSAQVTSTLNPSDTTFANGALIANPAACGTDEVLVGGGVAGTAKGTIDCEGDVVGVKGTYSGVLTSSSQVTSTLNPADTTFAAGSLIANPSACATDEILVGGGVAGTAKGTIDCEGDVVGVKGTFTGAAVLSGGVSFGTPCTGVVATDAVTCSGNAGVITDDNTDINADATRAAITWTNSRISTSSVVVATSCSTNDTNASIVATVVPGSGTATLSLRNAGAGNQTSNGATKICFLVLN